MRGWRLLAIQSGFDTGTRFDVALDDFGPRRMAVAFPLLGARISRLFVLASVPAFLGWRGGRWALSVFWTGAPGVRVLAGRRGRETVAQGAGNPETWERLARRASSACIARVQSAPVKDRRCG